MNASRRPSDVAIWRNRDNRARVGLRFNVSGRWASDRDVVSLPVGQRFNESSTTAGGERGPRPVFDGLTMHDELLALAHMELAVEAAMQTIDAGHAPIIGIGYSRGGRLVMDWAAAAAGGPYEPDALLSVFPASGEDPEEDLSSIPHSTRIVVLVGDSDEVVGNLGAIALLDQLLIPGVPDPNRRLEVVRSGGGFAASHLSVLETTPGARAAFWKRADRLIAAVRSR
jgi:hypothetical protein